MNSRGGREEERGARAMDRCKRGIYNRTGGGMFGEIGLVKFRTGCMMKNTVRRTGFLLVSLISQTKNFS